MILLDTQALVWLIEGDPRLGERARARIEAARSQGGVLIPVISIWEASMLVDKGRLVLSRPVTNWFDAVLSLPGFYLADITVAISSDAGALPGGIHGHPADRLIIATARGKGCPLLTADRQILAYAQIGYVQTIDARR